MAIFGTLNTVENQTNKERFAVAFKYLYKVINTHSEENTRLLSYPLDAFEKIELDDNNFALEQVYINKEREKCFFESHKRYIDVQFILEGEEIIEVSDISSLNINLPFDEEMDLIKYKNTNKSTKIYLKAGDVAIFYPNDAHMPCIKTTESSKVIKTVVKVKV